MDFNLNIGRLINGASNYDKIIETVSEQKSHVHNAVIELIGYGWTGEAADKFTAEHNKYQELFAKVEEEIKYMRSCLDREERPKAVQLKKRCEDFVNCITGTGENTIVTGDDTGTISLQYGGQYPIILIIVLKIIIRK